MVTSSRTELVRGTKQDQDFVRGELSKYRVAHSDFVRATHTTTSFVTLAQLVSRPEYQRLIDQDLMKQGFDRVDEKLSIYGDLHPMPLDRVWVGIGRTTPDNSYGGFHHPNQGYRHIQECAILSVAGSMTFPGLAVWLASIELLKAYTHDTMHYNSFRTYRRLPEELDAIPAGGFPFYRMQYGINFRKWDGKSYSDKDPVKRVTTRNLGVIMEAAVDRFAQEIVFDLASSKGYLEPVELIEKTIYRDATGLVTPEDVSMLHSLEKSEQGTLDDAEQSYLKSLRLFSQYVTMRYRDFFAEYDPDESHNIHQLVIEGILSGRFRALTSELDAILQQKRAFVSLFKSLDY